MSDNYFSQLILLTTGFFQNTKQKAIFVLVKHIRILVKLRPHLVIGMTLRLR